MPKNDFISYVTAPNPYEGCEYYEVEMSAKKVQSNDLVWIGSTFGSLFTIAMLVLVYKRTKKNAKHNSDGQDESMLGIDDVLPMFD